MEGSSKGPWSRKGKLKSKMERMRAAKTLKLSGESSTSASENIVQEDTHPSSPTVQEPSSTNGTNVTTQPLSSSDTNLTILPESPCLDDSFSIKINTEIDESSDVSSDEGDSSTIFSSDDALQKYHEWVSNQTEEVWGEAKRYSRSHCDYTFQGLDKVLIPALESVRLDTIRKYFRKCREYMQAYRDGKSGGNDVENAVKLYKSHRRVFGKVE